jgi:hypothetical protein
LVYWCGGGMGVGEERVCDGAGNSLRFRVTHTVPDALFLSYICSSSAMMMGGRGRGGDGDSQCRVASMSRNAHRMVLRSGENNREGQLWFFSTATVLIADEIP